MPAKKLLDQRAEVAVEVRGVSMRNGAEGAEP
jgi:hypothetical protein